MAKASNKKKKGNETPFKKNAFDDIPDEINHRESNQANAYTILNKCITVGDKIENLCLQLFFWLCISSLNKCCNFLS